MAVVRSTPSKTVSRPVATSSIIPVNINEIAIVGFGLSGILLGINLLQDKFQGILHIIDPRLDEVAIRSGDVRPEVFSDYFAGITPYPDPIKPSRGYHIKDIENQARNIFDILQKSSRCKVMRHKKNLVVLRKIKKLN